MLSLFCVSNLYAGTGTNDGTNFPTSGNWPGGRLTKDITVYITGTVWIKSPVEPILQRRVKDMFMIR